MRARGLWHPELARVYGIRPWEMSRLTARELSDIERHHEELHGGS